MTHTVPLINKMVATPRVANDTDALVVFVPAMYDEVGLVVIVMLPVVLLKMDTTSPVANVLFGTTIEPLVPTPINLPTSVVTSVYEVVLSDPDCGMLR